MIHWNAETDARLFMAVLQVHHVKLSALSLEQISKIMTASMGPDSKGVCTPKAVSHRIAKIRILGGGGSSAPNTPSKRRASNIIKQENPSDIDPTSLSTKLAGFKRERSGYDDEEDDQSYDDVSSPNTLLDAGTPTPKCTPRKPKSTTTTPRKRTKKTQPIPMVPLIEPPMPSLYESTSDTSSNCDYNSHIGNHSFPQSSIPHIPADLMFHSFNPDPYNNYTDIDEAVASSWLQELAPHDLPPYDQ